MFSPPDYSAPENFTRPRLGPWTVLLFMHRNAILRSLQKALPQLKGKLLDVGCGNKPYSGLINCDSYTGIDVAASPHERDKFDAVFDGMHIPFEDASFDSVICTEVLEHCKDPMQLMAEISRVLKKDGHAFITAPMFLEHHEMPYDFRRLTWFGMKQLAEENNFDVHFLDKRGGFLSVWIAATYTSVAQFLSRRPFSDILYWLLFPFMYFILLFDHKRQQSPPISSLGWQMMIKKN